MNEDRLLDRFLRYVRIHTTADDATDRYPSSDGQLELGRMLVAELRAMGVADAKQDEHGIVTGTVPATIDRMAPVVAFNAHLDTSPETSGEGVKPQVIRNYPGGDITLPGDPSKVIRAKESPELNDLRGRTLITTDGTTLLGGDDKAGVAVIMETVHWLIEHPEIPHGPVKALFTCDEEIGRGVKHVDVKQLGADVCYTLDGSGAGVIDVETFSAGLATITVRGVNIHPSIAKDRMVNAVRAAGEFVARLPRDTLAPEVTSGREGFLHPYQIDGGVAQTRIRVLLRDFETAKLAWQAERLREIARDVEKIVPGVSIDIHIARQYRNMAEGLAREPRAVAYAREAFRRLGKEAKLDIVRGGTDGSQLTELGLPTPNLSTGQHNIHSPLEYACLEEMTEAGRVLLELAPIWAEG
ncbi:MAG: peptidase T [Planctomycetes bacterium]|nr:peptidase T [Planctomycetota bacterium]